MLIRMTTSIAGADFVLHPGDEREFPDDEAVRLVAAEYAVPVAEQRVERAVVAETATEQRKRGRPRKEV